MPWLFECPYCPRRGMWDKYLDIEDIARECMSCGDEGCNACMPHELCETCEEEVLGKT